MKIIQNKKADFNFVWLFAIIAGTAFLMLAVYGAIKIGGGLKLRGDTEIAKALETIADPLQPGFAESTTGKITFARASQINPSCYGDGGFGYHMISVISESDFLKNSPPTPIEIKIPNKYIFAEQDFGKEFTVFSKKFELGFAIADPLFITTREYCLINPPEYISEEILGLNIKSIRINNGVNNTCTAESLNVCFNAGSDCNMTVQGNCNDALCEDTFETGTVTKGSKTVTYVGSLLFGAIFSDKDLYECNVKRLLYRAGQASEVFAEKADLMDARGCNSLLNSDLRLISQQELGMQVSQLRAIYLYSKDIKKKEQKGASCSLW